MEDEHIGSSCSLNSPLLPSSSSSSSLSSSLGASDNGDHHFRFRNDKNSTIDCCRQQEDTPYDTTNESNDQEENVHNGINNDNVVTATALLDRRRTNRSSNSARTTIINDSSSDDHNNSSGDNKSSMNRCRVLLVVVSFLFATFNITLRAVYSIKDAPKPSVLSSIRGYLIVIFFVPLFVVKRLRADRRHPQQQCNRNSNSNNTQQQQLRQRLLQEDQRHDREVGSTLVDQPVSDEGNEINTGTTNENIDHGEEDSIDSSSSSNHDNNNNNNSMFQLCLAAAELSLWNFSSQAVYNIGIMSVTSSARASFLGQTSIVMTPFIVCISGQHVPINVWFGSLAAMIGLLCLSWTPPDDTNHSDYDDNDNTSGGEQEHESSIWISSPPPTGLRSTIIATGMHSGNNEQVKTEWEWDLFTTTTPSSSMGLSFGDWMILLSSATWSLYIIRTCSYSTKFEDVTLQFMKNVINAIWYTCWWIVDSHIWRDNLWVGWNGPLAWLSWSILIYSAFGPGILADLLQQNAQASVAASEANIFLAIEPIFTAVLGFSLLGESLSRYETVGGCFLIVGSIIASGVTKNS